MTEPEEHVHHPVFARPYQRISAAAEAAGAAGPEAQMLDCSGGTTSAGGSGTASGAWPGSGPVTPRA